MDFSDFVPVIFFGFAFGFTLHVVFSLIAYAVREVIDLMKKCK